MTAGLSSVALVLCVAYTNATLRWTKAAIGMKTLVTKRTLAKLLLTDPRVKKLQLLEPVAYLLTGRGKLPLFLADNELTKEKK
jgi:hypothetical protein